MRFYWLILGMLAVWRITHLLQAEDGPWNLLVRFRRWLGNGMLGGLLDCFYCLSLWISVPFAWWVGENWKARLLLWPALSGAAILLEKISNRMEIVPPPVYYEEEEKERDHVLRTEP